MRLFILFVCLSTLLPATAQTKWQPANCPLPTPWTNKVSPENALPEYPRPQMTRDKWLNLNGEWDFMMMDKGTEEIVKKGKILVPFPVESALSGIGWKVEPKHLLVYNRTFMIPADWAGQNIKLNFGAVDYETEVFVNTRKVGSHKGGYDPFSFDITPFLKDKSETQHITVQVGDPTDKGGQAIGKQRLNPTGIWYTASSGIWQTVWLEPVAKSYIENYRVEPDIDKSRLLVKVETAGQNKGFATITARVFENGQKLSEAKGRAGTPLLLNIRKELHLWTLDDPYLYELEISLGDGKDDDRVKGYFGMRKVSIGEDENGDTKILLNNKPLFQTGVLDQGFYPDGLYTAPTEEAMLFDLQTMKSMGFNMIRKHVKVEPSRWYHLCDKMGLLVWQDMPNASNNSDEDKTQFRWELKAMIDKLSPHPSVIMWVPFNEGWGQHNSVQIAENIKKWDPTRLVNNASGWTDEGAGDVLDIHAYPGPDAPPKEKDRAIVLGEFGGLGLNVRGHKWSNDGWGYQLIETPDALLTRYEELWYDLHTINDTAGLSAVVYTQLSDVETENNGLITYDRKVIKMEPTLLKAAHLGNLPPRPKNSARIFSKNRMIELETLKPDAAISYTLDQMNETAEWIPYTSPFIMKKGGPLRCRAEWPNGYSSYSTIYHFEKVKPVKSKAPKELLPGISMKVYEGEWDNIPNFSSLTPTEHSTVNNFKIEEANREENFAIVFDTWIEIEETGVYTFYVSSDDGSVLKVANQKIVDNDGLHGMREFNGSIALKKGRHPLLLSYFQKGGGKGLEVWMEGPSGEPMKMKLFH